MADLAVFIRCGHPRTPENTYTRSGRSDRCRECNLARENPNGVRRPYRYKSDRWSKCGHPRTPENTTGDRAHGRCLHCTQETRWRVAGYLNDAGQPFTRVDYGRLLERQGNRCAVCREPFSKAPHVDHNRRTGRVRAILCCLCNPALGLMREDRDYILALAEYVRLHEVSGDATTQEGL